MKLYKRKKRGPKFLPKTVYAIQYAPDTIGEIFREIKALNPGFVIDLHPFHCPSATIREGDFVLVMKDDIQGYDESQFKGWFEEVKSDVSS
jgi:hypothetical protein